MNRLKYVLNMLLLFLSIGLYAQTGPSPLFKKCPVSTINYEQGLLYNQAYQIITDSLGFTWVSTSIGLQRYTGYTLENINPVIGRDTIKIKYPVAFFNLKNGRLWISCKKGIVEYNPKTNNFTLVIPLNFTPKAFCSIIPIKETNGEIWCADEKLGLVVYSPEGKLLRVARGIDPVIITKLIATEQWVATSYKDLIFIRDPGTQGILEFNIAEDRIVADRKTGFDIFGLTCDGSSLYITTTDGISRYAIDPLQLIYHRSFQGITAQSVLFSNLLYIHPGRVAVSVNNQLVEYNSDLSQYKIFTKLSGAPIVPTGNIGVIYYDKFERIWLITNDDIKRIQDRDIPFLYLKYQEGTNNFVRSLYFDEKKQLLIAGCLNGGLQLYDNAANPMWGTPLITAEVKDVLGIEKLTDDNYLVITWLKGWYILTLSTKKITKLQLPANFKYADRILRNGFTDNIQRINDSTVLVACSSNVFSCVFHQNKMVSCDPMLPFIKTDNDPLSSFVYTRSGDLWTGSNKGNVYKIRNNNILKTLQLPDGVTIRCIIEDAEGHIWAGTNRGLFVYDGDGRLLNSFFKHSGLLNDCIYALVPVNHSARVFASSNMGLSDISLNGKIQNYTRELGLQDNEFNTSAALKTADGKFYFGGVNGISAFYPNALTEIHDKPVLNITRLVVNDSTFNSSAGTWSGDTVELRYDQNHIQLDFAAMGLLNADKYLYKYRLLGFEKTWQTTYQPTGIRYILGTGNYTLQINCRNALSGDVFKKNVAIIIHPPWWLTWWFLLVVGILAIGIVIMVVSFYNKRQYDKKLQELIIKQSIQTERERISRDLHDNLGAQANAIFYGTELLMHEDNREQKLVDNLHDTASDMLTVLRETLWAMKITQVDAADLWLRILNFARKIGNYYAAIKIDIGGTPPGKVTLNASMALNMILIVQEAINNAIRHSGATTITITSYCNKNLWRIEIMDNGNGFDLAAVGKKEESYGLENMAERASESNIIFEINSLPSHGTKVFLEINLHTMESQLT